MTTDTEWDRYGFKVSYKLLPLVRVAGPRLGGDMQSVISGAKRGDWYKTNDGDVICAGIKLMADEYFIETVFEADDSDRYVSAPLPGGGLVIIDVRPTPELEREGVALDIIRMAQSARRAADLVPSEYISLTISGTPDVASAIEENRSLVMKKTRATKLTLFDSLYDLKDFDFEETVGSVPMMARVKIDRLGVLAGTQVATSRQ